MGRRREERLKVRLPVRVWGMDGNGKPFIQSAHTVDITRMGGRLSDLFCIDKKGEVIRVQHGNQKCNFRVTWIGNPGTGEAGQVGVYSLEPDKYIWNVALPKRTGPDAFEVKEKVEFVGFDQHQSGRFAQSGAAAAPAPATQGENRPGKRRVHPRYACTGTVEVAPEGSNMPLWCILSDISVSGCYAETTSPLPAHTQVHAVVKTGGIEFHAKGVIRTSHPAVGMGISFSALNPMDKERLESFIEQLRQDLAKGPAPVAQPSAILKPGTVTAKPEAPASQKPVSVRIDSTLMARLTQLRSDLWEMQHSFQPNTLDSRILREVKEAVDHARQSIWFAQQWMELQAEKRDPFPLVDKLNAERLRQSRELNRQLAVDVDAGELAVELQGLEDLYFSIRDLHTRLSKILNKPKA